MWSALCVFSCDSPLVEEENGFGMDGHICTACNSVIVYSMYGKRTRACVRARESVLHRVPEDRCNMTHPIRETFAHAYTHTYCSYICRTPCAFHTPARSFIFHHQRLVDPNRCKRSNDSIHTALSSRRPPPPRVRQLPGDRHHHFDLLHN